MRDIYYTRYRKFWKNCLRRGWSNDGGKKLFKAIGGKKFNRGDEKGYFLFGGSTVAIFGQPGKWKPDTELVEHRNKGWETLVQLGK